MAYYQEDDQEQQDPTLKDVEPYVPGQTQKSPEYVAPEVYDPGEQGTVSGQMKGLLSSGSPYMQAADLKGREYANKRGLLNSSMGAEASQKSAIESALPIAQQDAQTYAQSGLSKQQFEQQAGLTDIQAGASSKLSAQEATQSAQLESLQQEGENYRQNKEIALKERLSASDVTLAEKNAISNTIAGLGDNYQSQVGAIQTDPNMSPAAKASAIQSIQAIYEANIQSVGSIYNVEINWELP